LFLAAGIVISRYGKVAPACQAITPRRKAALQREKYRHCARW